MIQERLVSVLAELHRRHNTVVDQLSEDELVLTEYRRNVESHIYLDSFLLRGKERDGRLTLRRERRISVLERRLSLAEIRSAITRATGTGDVEAARRIANQVADSVTAYHHWLYKRFDLL